MTKTTTRPEARTQFTIDVYPHVKKFLVKKFKIKNNTLVLAHCRIVSKFARLVLLEKESEEDASQKSQFRDRLTETITIVLTARQARMCPRISKLIKLNHHLDELFKEHLLTWIDVLKENNMPVRSACKLFIQFYKLDENEYGLETAYKYWQRESGKQ